jgi:hypothetical protein
MLFNSRICVTLAVVLIFCVMPACDSNSPAGDETLVRSGLAREMNPEVSDEELAAVASGNTRLALALPGCVPSGIHRG